MTDIKTSLSWTVWTAYSATGEGVTYCVLVTYAADSTTAKALFSQKFGEYLTRGADCAQGVVCNGITRKLFSPEAFETMRNADGKAALEAYATMHVNYS